MRDVEGGSSEWSSPEKEGVSSLWRYISQILSAEKRNLNQPHQATQGLVLSLILSVIYIA